jgi:FtsH-binding integral membrane protein
MNQDNSSQNQDKGGQPTTEQQVKQMFAALACGALLAGAAVYLLREVFGIPDDTARMVALVFVLVAVVDGLVVIFWDRFFKRS